MFLIMMHIHVLYIRMFFPIMTRLLFIVTSIDHLRSTSKGSYSKQEEDYNKHEHTRTKKVQAHFHFQYKHFVVLKNTTPYRTSDSAYTHCIKTWRLIIPFSVLGHTYSTNALAVCCRPQLLV